FPAALLEVAELVEAGARGREQDDVTRTRGTGGRLDGRREVAVVLVGGAGLVQRGRDRAGRLPDQVDRPDARQLSRELAKALALERAAEDHVQPGPAVGGDAAPRRRGVRRLRVVHEADAVELPHELEPVLDAGEG